eukprot:jgi/Picsp_1/3527/NSC_06365-R1_---NA---
MGNCVSYAPQGVPVCERCGKQGTKEWHLMNKFEKKKDWRLEGNTLLCSSCGYVNEADAKKFERERQYYSRAKQELYPKEQHKERLKRLKSNEKWEGTASFYASYRPPSKIAHLVEDTKDGLGGSGRRGTGYVAPESKRNSSDKEKVELSPFEEDLEMTIVEEEILGSREYNEEGLQSR